MHTLSSVMWWMNAAALALASAIDIRTRRIPNWLVVPFLGLSLAAQAAAGGWSGAGRGLAGAALASLCFVAPCFLGAMGMGDLKLAAGVGAWIGPGQVMIAMVMTALAGGVLAIGFAAWQGTLGASLDRTGDLLSGLANRRIRRPQGGAANLSIPYAPAIAFGALASFLTR